MAAPLASRAADHLADIRWIQAELPFDIGLGEARHLAWCLSRVLLPMHRALEMGQARFVVYVTADGRSVDVTEPVEWFTQRDWDASR